MTTAERPLVIFLMGATAVGKTALAAELARRVPCELISVDSAMVYRGLDIGTAKPSPQVLADTPHRLIDICAPDESYSAARFRADAQREINDILASRRLPLLVGGTGLYFRALESGLSPLPPADAEVRARLAAEAAVNGWAALHARLREIDPVAARRISANDPQRIQRALEVFEITGRPMTALQEASVVEPFPFRVVKIIVSLEDRDKLAWRIHCRFSQMLARGLVEEVEQLHRRVGLDERLPAMRAVGYRQIREYLDGKRSYRNAVERAVTATRQYAKRQMTWLRSEENGHWLPGGDPELVNKALKIIKDNHS